MIIRRTPALTALFVVLVAGACSGGGGTDGGGRGGSSASQAPVREEWRWDAPSSAYVGIPEADAEGVVVSYGRHWLVLLDGAGNPRWTATADGLRDIKPLLTPEVVIAGTDDGLVAFGRAGGDRLWAAALGERANTPVIAGGRAVTSTWEGSLVAVDPRDGAVMWRARLPGAALGPPATDGHVVVSSWEADNGTSAGVVAVDAVTGARRWEAELEPGGVSAPAVSTAAGVVVVVAGDVAVHGLALDRGTRRWRAELEGAGSPEVPPLALEDGEVLLGHRLGGLALVDARDGRVSWMASSDGAAVRGGPAGPGPDGRFALPLDDGRVLLAGPDRPQGPSGPSKRGTQLEFDPPGRVSGVAAGPGGLLLVATRESGPDGLIAVRGW